MNSLQVVREGQTMTSREIADLVELRHDNVCRTIQNLAAESIIRLPQIEEVKNDQNQTVKQYRIGKRDTFVIVARLSPAFTARLVDRWQELEAQQAPSFRVPQSMSEALRLAADLSDKVIEQAKQIEAAAPAVAFVEQYADANTTKGFRQVCKMLNANENDFRTFLKARSIMYKLGGEWVAYSQHIDAGRFIVRQGVAGDHAFSSVRFTQKGVLWVAGEWAKFQIKEVA